MRESWRVKVSGLKDGSNQIRFELSPEDIEIRPWQGCELTLTRDVIAELDLLKQGARVYVSGTVNFQAEMNCSICAEPFRRESTEKLYIEFERGLPATPGHIHELGEDDLVRTYYSQDEVNLLPVIRDTILLSNPIAPQCRPDCKGICPECGANLNQGGCACCEAAAVSQ
jgi:uncharacterized protein